jgi:hypothetical protein
MHAAFSMITLCLLLATTAEAQGVIPRMKTRLKDQAQGRINRAAEEVADTVASKAEKAVRCMISDKQCVKAAQEAGQPVIVTDASGQVISTDAAGQPVPPDAASAVPDGAGGAGQSAPTPIVAIDFSADAPGAQSAQVEVHEGQPVVTDAGGRRWLALVSRGAAAFSFPLPESLPAAYTIAFDVLGHGGMVGVHPSGEKSSASAFVETSGIGGINDGTGLKNQPLPQRKNDVVHRVLIAGQGEQMTVAIDGVQLAARASADLAARGNRVRFTIRAYGRPAMIGNITIATPAE